MPQIEAHKLDGEIVQDLKEMFQETSDIKEQLLKGVEDSQQKNDLPAVERALKESERKRKSLAESVSQLRSEDARQFMLEEIDRISEQIVRLEGEREEVLTRGERQQQALRQIDDIEEWCRKVGERFSEMDWKDKRAVFETLGLRVWLYKADDEDHKRVEAEILWQQLADTDTCSYVHNFAPIPLNLTP